MKQIVRWGLRILAFMPFLLCESRVLARSNVTTHSPGRERGTGVQKNIKLPTAVFQMVGHHH